MAKISAAASSGSSWRTWQGISFIVLHSHCSSSCSAMGCQKRTYMLLSCLEEGLEYPSCRLSSVEFSVDESLTSKSLLQLTRCSEVSLKDVMMHSHP